MTDSQTLALLDAGLRGTLLALLLLLTVVLRRDHPRLPAAQVGIALCLGQCVQIISSAPLFEALVPRLWQAPWVAVSVGNAVLFWTFVQALFDDDFAWRPLHAAAWLFAATLSGLNCALLANGTSPLASATMGLQRALPLLFSILAALAAAKHWRADLVEERRRLRTFIVVTGVAYTLASMAARLGSPQGRLAGLTATLDVAVLLVIVAVVASRLLRLSSSDLFPLRVSLAPALQGLMVDQRAYRAEDLTVASLAARLAVHEYRLRRLINQRLGHRNFNAFVNGFRLDQARHALADPTRRELPVLTIALDSGFQSIGPFNRAFKAATGLTPTEFRKENLADS